MDLNLNKRVAVITGCSVGIGREIAKVLAAEGSETAIIARRERLLIELQDEIEAAAGRRSFVIPTDICERDSAERIFDAVMGEYGRIDILVNNAGGSRPMAWDESDEAWDESFALNFTAVRKLTQTILPVMIEAKWGRVICITGSGEPEGVNGAYSAKAGVHAWAKGLSREIGKYGISINCVAPGRIHSEQIDNRVHPTREEQEEFARKNIPLGYFGEPKDVAYFVAFLCSSQARYITGERIYIDGGLHRAY